MNSKSRIKIIYVASIFHSFYFFSCVDNDDLSRCQLEPEAGPCEALVYKYYFDKDEQKCKEFFWGGCDGVVPFDTLEECRECE